MSKLNPKNAGVTQNKMTISHNGNVQSVKAEAQQLYEIIVSTLYGKDDFYEDNDARLVRLVNATEILVKKDQMDFIANAILHARHVMNIRAMPLILTVVFAKIVRDQNKQYGKMRELVRDVIARADQITDMYAIALRIFGGKNKIPMAVKRGVADAFNKFDAYQLGKYNVDGAVKLRDVLRITHPSPAVAEQGAVFEKIMAGTLETPYTWETELSANGQKPVVERKSKARLWGELVASGQMGYMALLRNLRNISEAFEADPDTVVNVSAQYNQKVETKARRIDPAELDAKVDAPLKDVMEVVYARLADPFEVKRSKQLPFRFISALDNVQQFGNTKLVRSISRALDASLSNIPKIGNNVWIIIDCSGSMGGGYGHTTANSPIATACLFAAALAKANAEATNLKITMFSDNAAHVAVNTDDSIVSIKQSLVNKVYGGGTNLQAALDMKGQLGFEPDTVIVLSDMEVNSLRAHNSASSIFSADTVKIAINLASNDSTPIGEKAGWYQLAGWSEKLFSFIPAMRNKTSVVKTLSVPYLGMEIKNLHTSA